MDRDQAESDRIQAILAIVFTSTHRTCTQELTRSSFYSRRTLADNLNLKISHLGAKLLTNFTVHKCYWSAAAAALAVIQLESFAPSPKPDLPVLNKVLHKTRLLLQGPSSADFLNYSCHIVGLDSVSWHQLLMTTRDRGGWAWHSLAWPMLGTAHTAHRGFIQNPDTEEEVATFWSKTL